MRARGGAVYAISSEPQTLADRAQAGWKLDFPCVGDPHHEIAAVCRERGWLDLVVNERLEFPRSRAPAGNAWAPTHPKGYFQPGVLAVHADGRVLYRWRSIPTRRNAGGAIRRPLAGHVAREVEHRLAESGATGDAPLDESPPMDAQGIWWPLFVVLLVANGWFLRPRGFSSPARIPFAAVRLAAFVGAWVAAFVWLPMPLAALGLVGWLVFILPRIRWVQREFQSIVPPNPETTGG